MLLKLFCCWTCSKDSAANDSVDINHVYCCNNGTSAAGRVPYHPSTPTPPHPPRTLATVAATLLLRATAALRQPQSQSHRKICTVQRQPDAQLQMTASPIPCKSSCKAGPCAHRRHCNTLPGVVLSLADLHSFSASSLHARAAEQKATGGDAVCVCVCVCIDGSQQQQQIKQLLQASTGNSHHGGESYKNCHSCGCLSTAQHDNTHLIIPCVCPLFLLRAPAAAHRLACANCCHAVTGTSAGKAWILLQLGPKKIPIVLFCCCLCCYCLPRATSLLMCLLRSNL
jgi:hypothetical protein